MYTKDESDKILSPFLWWNYEQDPLVNERPMSFWTTKISAWEGKIGIKSSKAYGVLSYKIYQFQGKQIKTNR